MRRGVLVAFSVLGLAACGQSDQGTADVAAGSSPYSGTCLEMAAAQNWSEAARLCSMALAAEPSNDKVKDALNEANKQLAGTTEPSSAVSPESGEAAGEAADDAAEQLPN
jgi:hypothetical protein